MMGTLTALFLFTCIQLQLMTDAATLPFFASTPSNTHFFCSLCLCYYITKYNIQDRSMMEKDI